MAPVTPTRQSSRPPRTPYAQGSKPQGFFPPPSPGASSSRHQSGPTTIILVPGTKKNWEDFKTKVTTKEGECHGIWLDGREVSYMVGLLARCNYLDDTDVLAKDTVHNVDLPKAIEEIKGKPGTTPRPLVYLDVSSTFAIYKLFGRLLILTNGVEGGINNQTQMSFSANYYPSIMSANFIEGPSCRNGHADGLTNSRKNNVCKRKAAETTEMLGLLANDAKMEQLAREFTQSLPPDAGGPPVSRWITAITTCMNNLHHSVQHHISLYQALHREFEMKDQQYEDDKKDWQQEKLGLEAESRGRGAEHAKAIKALDGKVHSEQVAYGNLKLKSSEEHAKVQGELTDANDRISKMKVLWRKREDQFTNKEQSLKDEVAEVKAKLDDEVKQHAIDQLDYEETTKAFDKVKASQQAMKDDIAKSESKCASMATELGNLRAQRSNPQLEKATIARAVAEAVAKAEREWHLRASTSNTVMQVEKDNLETELQELRTNNMASEKKLESELAQLRLDNEAKEGKMDTELAQARAAKVAQEETLREVMAAHEATVGGFAARVSQLEQDLGRANTQLRDARADLRNLKSTTGTQLTSTKEEVAAAKQEAERQKSLTQASIQQSEGITVVAEQSNANGNEARAQTNEELTTALQKSQAENAELQRTMNALKGCFNTAVDVLRDH